MKTLTRHNQNITKSAVLDWSVHPDVYSSYNRLIIIMRFFSQNVREQIWDEHGLDWRIR